jgi:hypothetical protein
MNKLANISNDELKKIKEIENKLNVVLVAYEKKDIKK